MPAVVVTGASKGIGRACALELDRRGFRVFAGIRDEDDSEALQRNASNQLTPVYLDVTEPDSIVAMAKTVESELGDDILAGVVNNAGSTLPYPIEYLPLEGFRSQLEVNLVGPLAVTQALLKLLQRDRGRVVNVTSLAGKAGIPMMAAYTAAKHGLEGLSDVMRLEFGPLGVAVSVIEPGLTATDMGRKLVRDVNTTAAALTEEGRLRYEPQLSAVAESIGLRSVQGSDPRVVAQAVIHALSSDRPRTRYPVGPGAKRMMLMRRVLPDRWFDRISLRVSGVNEA